LHARHARRGCEADPQQRKGPGRDLRDGGRRICRSRPTRNVRSYHGISVVGREAAGLDAALEPIVIAGPLCESGDVFTRDEAELLQPRLLPRPAAGDLLTIRDAGAYGYAMSSNYNSIGRAPQLWLEEDGRVESSPGARLSKIY
jgi:hypothetical protein